MIPLIVSVPDAASVTDKSDVHTHLYCCDPDRALCGVDLSGGEFVDDEEPTECFACVAIDEAKTPCRARFCRLRSWWRERRPK